MTHASRWTTTFRNDACAGRLWGGRTTTAQEPSGAVAWPRCSFLSWPLSSYGRSILGCGSTGTCKAAPRPGASHQLTSNHSCPGTYPKTCVRNCGRERRQRNQTPVDPDPACLSNPSQMIALSSHEQRKPCASTTSAVIYEKSVTLKTRVCQGCVPRTFDLS